MAGARLILFSTISPIELRPHTLTTVNVDRAGAYAFAGMIFVLAYPRHWMQIGLLLVVRALGFEFLQEFSTTRHARLHDALVKAGGAIAGVVTGYAINRVRRRRMVGMQVAG